MSGKLLQSSLRRVSKLPKRIFARKYAQAAPTGQPIFTKQGTKESSLTPLLAATAGAFALTVGILHFTSPSTGNSHELRPIRYGNFEVLEARKTNSPSRTDVGDNEHVYLKIKAPLSKEAIMLNTHLSKPDEVQILSVYMKEPSLQIERPYTPLYSDAIDGRPYNAPVELLIKRYVDGELGKYAHRLGEQVEVELRGPLVTWQGPRVDHFLLVRSAISQCLYCLLKPL
jgi:hypothetical protein